MRHTNRSLTRRFARLAVLLGAGAASLIPVASAAATTPIGDQVRLSFSGPDADPKYDTDAVDAAYDPRSGRHLVVWSRQEDNGFKARIFGRFVDGQGAPVGAEFPITDHPTEGNYPAVAHNVRNNEFLVAYRGQVSATETEIFIRRLGASGTPLGPETRVSRMGPDGDGNYDAQEPAIAYDENRNEYLVVWSGDDDTGPLVDNEAEIFGQRLTADGTRVGTNGFRISDMGPDGDPGYYADAVAIAHAPLRDEYMVVWQGEDDVAPLVNQEFEVFAQRLSGDGTEIGPNDRRISSMGPDGDTGFGVGDPSIAHNPVTGEYLVVWAGDDDTAPLVKDEAEIFAQRLASDGSETGTDDQRISDMGPNGSTAYSGSLPAVTVNPRANEYLVTWYGDDDTAPLMDEKYEVFAQRLSATGAELDGNDVRVSVTPDAADTAAIAFWPFATYDAAANRYLIAWTAESTAAPLVSGHTETYARMFGAGTPVTATSVRCTAIAPLADPPKGDPSKITLTVDQLLINQRIDQAAIRRANGVQSWLDAGVESRDLCQASLGTAELAAGSIGGYTGLPATYAQPDPRPVVVPPAVAGDPSKVTLTVKQLLINQRISQAAIRRLNALKARLDAGLTGGDVDDGAVGRSQLLAGTTVLFTPVAAPVAASVTAIAPPSPGDPSKVTLTVNQLLINQRISQAAVKRANELIHRLGEGIGPEEIRDGTLTVADLVPGLALSTTP